MSFKPLRHPWLRAAAVAALLLLIAGTACPAEEDPLISHPVGTVLLDARNFYLSSSNMLRLGIGIAAAAVPANTNVDRWIRDKFQEEVRSGGTDDAAKVAKVPGTAYVTIPVYAGAYGIGYLVGNPTAGDWAQRSLRATVVGAPALLVLQAAIGSERPTDGSSHWKPFNSSNGVSGHAYIGAVPFVTAAGMSDSPYLKGLFYTLSALPGLSRINDDMHYFSQAALGWYLAWLSCEVVAKGKDEAVGRTQLGLAPLPGGMAVTVRRVF